MQLIKDNLTTRVLILSLAGKVPFLKVGPFMVSEFRPIVAHIATKVKVILWKYMK